MKKKLGTGLVGALALASMILLAASGIVFHLESALAQQPAGTYTGIPYGTTLPGSCNPGALTANPFFYLTGPSGGNLPGFYPCTGAGVFAPGGQLLTPSSYYVTTDFTTTSTSLVTITGLTWTMPANLAANVSFECHLAYSQATAAAADAFGIQDATTAPTNLFATGLMTTNVTAQTSANLPALTTTTATNIVSATPSAATTIWGVDLYGMIQQPSGAASAINIMALTGSGSDALTVKQGSYCFLK